VTFLGHSVVYRVVWYRIVLGLIIRHIFTNVRSVLANVWLLIGVTSVSADIQCELVGVVVNCDVYFPLLLWTPSEGSQRSIAVRWSGGQVGRLHARSHPLLRVWIHVAGVYIYSHFYKNHKNRDLKTLSTKLEPNVAYIRSPPKPASSNVN